MARKAPKFWIYSNWCKKPWFSPKKFVLDQIGRISLDWQSGRIPPKSEEMTGKPGLAREGTVRQGKNWPRRGDGHRSNKFRNEIYRVIHTYTIGTCIPTAAMVWRLLRAFTSFCQNEAKMRFWAAALQQRRRTNEFPVCLSW